MVRIDCSKAIRDMKRANRDLAGSVFDSAVVSAINHTLSTSKTAASREIRKTHKIRAKDLAPNLKVQKAKRGKATWEISGALIATGRPLGLIRFGAKQNKRGVSVNIMGKRKTIAKAFIATLKSGHVGVFARGHYGKGDFIFRKKRVAPPSKNDVPITELTTVSVPTAFSNDVVIKHLTKQMAERFPSRLAHELARRRSNVGG